MAVKNLQLRIDESLKSKAENVFSSIGLDCPTAVRMFFKQVVLNGGIPFSLTQYTENGFTVEEEAEIMRVSQGIDDGSEETKSAHSFEELKAKLMS